MAEAGSIAAYVYRLQLYLRWIEAVYILISIRLLQLLHSGRELHTLVWGSRYSGRQHLWLSTWLDWTTL